MLPGPTNVPSRVLRAMIKPVINHRGPEFEELHERIVENARYVFQTKGDIFVLTCSGTGGVECAVQNVVTKGDKILVPIIGVFSERLATAAERLGGKVVKIPVEWGKGVMVSQVEDALEKEKDVKAVALVYNETSTGVTSRDLAKIGEICGENGLLLIVDAVSVLGGDLLPVDDWNVDICVTSSQKCLMCPPGMAPISVSEKAWSTIENQKSRGSYYFDLLLAREFQSEKRQTPFTPSVPLYYALDEALQMIREEGLENVFRRHRCCAQALYSSLESINLPPYAAKEFRSNTVLSVKVPAGIKESEVRNILREKYKVVVSGGMGKLKGSIIRIGSMGVVSRYEILRTVSALEHTLKELGISFKFGEGVSAAREVFDKEYVA